MNMNNQGWIKIHRKLLNSLIFSSEKGLKVWIWCLLKANHEETDFYIGRQKIHILPGQFVTGKNTAKEELEMAVGTIWFWLKQLEVEHNIERKSTNKYSVITILKWKDYQQIEPKIERRLNADRTQIVQQIEPNNNIENEENDNKISSKKYIKKVEFNSLTTLTEPILQEISTKYGVSLPFVKDSLDSMTNWLLAKNKTYHDYKAGLINWVKRDKLKVQPTNKYKVGKII